MTRKLQILRGTTAQNDAFTGSIGEMTMDTTKNELRLHDGVTPGGHIIGAGGGSDSGYHPDLFDVKWTDHALHDAQWLMAHTFSWHYGSVYQAAYQHLADDIDGKTLQSETIGSTTIQFYLADDGHKICPASEESNVATIYNATGVAWYYIIDTTNQRFKLPRTKFGFTGIKSGVVGAFVEAGLPNITAKVRFTGDTNAVAGGGAAYATADSRYHDLGAGTAIYSDSSVLIDASEQNAIYGNSDTVQPKATEMYLYFYVGNFTQTALENTAGLNAELFNAKADLNLSNTASNIDFVVESQEPTAANGYIWYRKYKSGWVEQGGCQNPSNSTSLIITLPVAMRDRLYTAIVVPAGSDNDTGGWSDLQAALCGAESTYTYGKAETSFRISCDSSIGINWQVSGKAAN